MGLFGHSQIALRKLQLDVRYVFCCPEKLLLNFSYSFLLYVVLFLSSPATLWFQEFHKDRTSAGRLQTGLLHIGTQNMLTMDPVTGYAFPIHSN